MKLYSFIALGLSLMLVGCSTHTSEKPTASIAPSTNYSQRSPTALDDFYLADDEETIEALEEINTSLKNNDAAIADRLKNRLIMVVEALPRGYKLMEQFDKDLAANPAGQEFKIFENDPYIKLLFLRDIVERLEQRVASGYAQLWRIYKGKVSDLNTLEIKSRAALYIEAFHRIILAQITPGSGVSVQQAELKRHSLNRLSAILYVLHQKLKEDINLKNMEEKKLYSHFTQLTARIHFGDQKKLNAHYNTHKKSMQSEANKLNDSELSQQLDKDLQDLKNERARLPNSNFVNVSGSNFPANNWALTFDDGPHKSHTQAIAKVLADNKIKGEFFWLSKNITGLKTVAKEIQAAGHHINSHSIDHSNLPKLKESAVKKQVEESAQVINNTVNEQLKIAGLPENFKVEKFRCPYGAGVFPPKSQKVIDAITNAGFTHVLWNVDSLDWQDKNTTSVLNRVLKQMKGAGHGIILFHDIHPIAEAVIPSLVKDAYVTKNKVQWVQVPK